MKTWTLAVALAVSVLVTAAVVGCRTATTSPHATVSPIELRAFLKESRQRHDHAVIKRADALFKKGDVLCAESLDALAPFKEEETADRVKYVVSPPDKRHVECWWVILEVNGHTGKIEKYEGVWEKEQPMAQ